MTKNMAAKSDLLKDAENFLKVTDKCVEKFVELLQSNEKEEIIKEKIKKFDVRDEMLKVIYKDCGCEKYKESTKHQNFRKAFEEFPRDNVLAWTEFGKIWARKFNYDYDDSPLMNYVYYWIYPQRFKNSEAEKEDPYEYVIVKDGERYRGDTMNSFQTTVNKFMDCFWEKYLWYDKGNLKSWQNPLRNSSIYKKDNPLPPYITEFMEVVYTIGNFMPVPKSPRDTNFNGRRGDCTGKLKDYWDLTLLAIYEYYIRPETKSFPSFDELLQKTPNQKWLGSFGSGDGQNRWNAFVKDNFMQPFVKKIGNGNYGKPYELWDGHFADKDLPKEEWQFEQFFVNARIRILERGELIAKELIKLVTPNTDQSQ